MRVADRLEIDRLLGVWYITVQGSNEETGEYTETTIPVTDIIEAIRSHAPELLKEES